MPATYPNQKRDSGPQGIDQDQADSQLSSGQTEAQSGYGLGNAAQPNILAVHSWA